MSDHSAESGFAPVALAAAMAQQGRFRPLHFGGPAVEEAGPAAPAAAAEAAPNDDLFARGLAEGQRLAEAGFAVEREQLLALVAGAEALQDEPSEELAQLIAETVERLVRQIVETAPIDSSWLQDQAQIAAAMVAEADKARTLWVNPADALLLAECPVALPVESDPSMMRGTVRIETSVGWIEHGRAVYLDELRAALGSEGTVA